MREKRVRNNLFLILCFLLSGSSYGQNVRDTLFFYHDQMIIGELHSLYEGYFEFDSEIARVIKIKNYKVVTFSATMHRYRVRTADGEIYYGIMEKSSQEGFVKIRDGDQVNDISIDSIIDLERFDGKFGKRITGDLSVGYNFTKSSDIGRLNVSFNLEYHARNFQSLLSGNSIMTQDEGQFSRDTENLVSTNIYSLNYRWLGIGLLSYQRNLELGILRRYQEGLLFGYNVVSQSDKQLLTGLGLAVNQELTEDDEKSANLVEIPFMIGFTLYRLKYPSIQLKVTQKMYFGVTDQGRFRNDANITLDYKIIKDFKISLNVYSNFDNEPSEESDNFDYGTVISIGYTFW